MRIHLNTRVRPWLYSIGALLIILAIGSPILVYFSRSETNHVETAIRKIRFFPLAAPSNLRGPGTIYVVSTDGQPDSAICDVPPERLKQVIQHSETETQTAQELRKLSIALDAKMEKTLKAQLEAGTIEAVTFSLEDVSVYEITIANLRTLAREMQTDESCAAAVEDYLKAGQYVCQGQQAVKATAKYSIRLKREAESSVSVDALRNAVRATVDPSAQIDGSKVTSGVGLFYGIRLPPLCFSLPGQKLPHAPPTWYYRLRNWII